MKNNSQVAHIWAQGNKKTANGSNLRCVDNRLYSYSTVIAFIDDRGTAFISSNGMSPTTSKHLSYANRAVNGQYFFSPAFSYGDFYGPSVRECIQATAKKLIAEYPAIDKSNSRKPKLIEWYSEKRKKAMDFAKRYRVKIPIIPAITPAQRKAAKIQAEKNQARHEKREAERARLYEERRKADEADFLNWLETGTGSAPISYRHGETDYLTISGDTVKTSQGAEAPLDHVKKAVAFYLSRKTAAGSFDPWQTNGHKIHLGHFTLDSISATGEVKAGCHTFSATEIERFTNHWNLRG